jgi:hypothetical protein
MIALVPNWKSILTRAWTVWLAVISALATYLQMVQSDVLAVIPALQPYLGEGQAGKVAMVAAVAVPLARVLKQTSLALDEARTNDS